MNKSGIKPVEFKVLVKPKAVKEKTAGGIVIPDQVKEKESFSVSEGELIAVAPLAFTDPDWLDKPQVGETVVFAKYAGRDIKGSDGEIYRLIDDRDLEGVKYE